MNKQGVISLGEAFVDYISIDKSNTKYEKLLGGATVNVAAGTSRLGVPSYYLCKLGTDETSQFVEQELKKENINIEFCIQTPNKKICGVYVHLNENGERYFHSYINPTPNEVLTENQLRRELFERSKIFYFGSGTLFQESAKLTTRKAINYAKVSNTLIAFDANIRLKRWESEDQCRKTVLSFLPFADIIKLAEDELYFLTETEKMDDGIKILSQWKIPFVFITMGSKGAYAALYNEKNIFVPGIEVKAVDTTGAGDAFMSALLCSFHEKGNPQDLSQLTEYTQYANQIGAIATTKRGSLSAFNI
ncbi:carbohydrate kinase [Paenibacillus sp. BSR1-1]|uniref:carbohydrate kinase family protein n=1 Tax=Paenibacillus sp. BSR1-1 TaxID=3020845 RepID=UPI0025B270F8|nr:carbohydrate kinase [Paenibacillus sp. BSR1-1]MDN3016389.1 carbohydrate kinase [Paenibacillus sp. BSR1-1]